MNVARRIVAPIVFAGLTALAAAGPAPAATAAAATSGVRQLLAASAAAWNRGDLDAFMRGYEDSPHTQHVSATIVIAGYAAIRAHYAAHYGKSGMGVLTFSDVGIRPLGADYAVVVARWHLSLANGGHPSGLFTLVLHCSTAGWHIVTDHSP